MSIRALNDWESYMDEGVRRPRKKKTKKNKNHRKDEQDLKQQKLRDERRWN